MIKDFLHDRGFFFQRTNFKISLHMETSPRGVEWENEERIKSEKSLRWEFSTSFFVLEKRTKLIQQNKNKTKKMKSSSKKLFLFHLSDTCVLMLAKLFQRNIWKKGAFGNLMCFWCTKSECMWQKKKKLLNKLTDSGENHSILENSRK